MLGEAPAAVRCLTSDRWWESSSARIRSRRSSLLVLLFAVEFRNSESLRLRASSTCSVGLAEGDGLGVDIVGVLVVIVVHLLLKCKRMSKSYFRWVVLTLALVR